MAATTARLQPGIEIVSSKDEAVYPTAFSSFAISVDSRDAEKNYKTPGTPSILKHGKSRSSSHQDDSYYKSYAKCKGSPPLGSFKHGVRFSISDKGWKDASARSHGRRSSTAVVMDYIRQHLPEHQHRPSVAITPKRAFLLFCIVFSATYLAMALIPLLTGNTQAYPGEIMVMRRGAGYYGNSHIFRAGENLADPHAAGDEHHQYVHHQQNSRKVDIPAGKTAPEQAAGQTTDDHVHLAPPKKLESSTLAEQAQLEELIAARRKIQKLEAILPVFAHVEQRIVAGAVVDAEKAGPMTAASNKKPAMPFNKLSDKSRKQSQINGEGASDGLDPVVPVKVEDATKPFGAVPVIVSETSVVPEAMPESELENEQEEKDLEAEITRLRQEAAARRKSKQVVQGKKARLASSADSASEDKPKKLERIGVKLGLVAKNRQAMFEGTAKELEVAAALSD